MGDVVVLTREFPSEVDPLEVRIIFRIQARIHCDSLGSLEDEPVVSANREFTQDELEGVRILKCVVSFISKSATGLRQNG